jgi:hypothetical protein
LRRDLLCDMRRDLRSNVRCNLPSARDMRGDLCRDLRRHVRRDLRRNMPRSRLYARGYLRRLYARQYLRARMYPRQHLPARMSSSGPTSRVAGPVCRPGRAGAVLPRRKRAAAAGDDRLHDWGRMSEFALPVVAIHVRLVPAAHAGMPLVS